MVTKDRTGHVFKKGNRFYLQYMLDGRRVKQVIRDADGDPVCTAEEAELRRKAVMAPLFVAEREDALRSAVTKLGDAVQQREAVERGTDVALPLAKAWDAYVASVNRPDSGPRTLEGYASQWRLFVSWGSAFHPEITELRQVSAAIAEQYAAYMLKDIREKRKTDGGDVQEVIVKRAFTTNTYNKHVRVLELVFRVLARKAALTGNPWTGITRKMEKRESRRELTVDELNSLCNQATGELQRLLILGIYTGMRLGDCCTLRWSEVDLVRRIILRVPNKTARRKGLPVHIPIHTTLLATLTQTPAGKRTGFVLPEFAARYRHEDADVAKEIQRFLIACGIQVHKDDTGKGTSKRAVVEVGFHSLRHSFVSLCRQSNAPLSVVEAIVGHSNPSMTRHYTHVGEVAASAAVAALPMLAFGAIERDGQSAGQASSGSKAAGNAVKSVLTERDQKVVAILGKMTAGTWEKDRDALLALLLGS